jgi:hypothetical protein
MGGGISVVGVCIKSLFPVVSFYIAVNNDMYSSSNQQLKNNVRSIAEAVVIATMTDIRGYHARVPRKLADAVSLLSVLTSRSPQAKIY